ncbi:BatD family protein [Roseiconus nitratireducens]|uniref:BatD family protein n=1 Tax=Roseiconus nitratireducens TaxID=2605748 RepID=UPI0013760BFB|nr:BatD family protein [Roseiconus nitratireducens]
MKTIVDQPQVWQGQRASFVVQLRSPGPFAGAASFTIPQVARTVIVKIGTPVVSSEQIEGDTWFTQDHEFVLFTQQSGRVEVPEFEVRFGSRDGFTGPVSEQIQKVPPVTFDVQAPPGADELGFLVTTDQIQVSQSWDPQPGKAKVGDVYHRTITQSADQVTGMALAPPPTTVPDGLRIYADSPEVSDRTERGAFSGTRRDRLTYVIQEPGTLTLPAIKYVWWNPKTKQYGSQTLPAATFEVAPPPPVGSTPATRSTFPWQIRIGLAVAAAALLVWQRRRIQMAARRWWQRLNPPTRAARRAVLRAAAANDPVAAETAWLRWQNLQPQPVRTSATLQQAVSELHRQRYGGNAAGTWNGQPLQQAFRDHLTRQERDIDQPDPLPQLNH